MLTAPCIYLLQLSICEAIVDSYTEKRRMDNRVSSLVACFGSWIERWTGFNTRPYNDSARCKRCVPPGQLAAVRTASASAAMAYGEPGFVASYIGIGTSRIPREVSLLPDAPTKFSKKKDFA